MLYVVAWPILAKVDDSALHRLRMQYHPREAQIIGPHFTLVFNAKASEEARLRTTLDGLAGRRPFSFALKRLVLYRMAPLSGATYLYAVPSDGAAELVALHNMLNAAWGVEAFVPHITLGLFDHAATAKNVAHTIERELLPMHGRIEELSLLRRDNNGLQTLAGVRLKK